MEIVGNNFYDQVGSGTSALSGALIREIWSRRLTSHYLSHFLPQFLSTFSKTHLSVPFYIVLGLFWHTGMKI